MTAFPEPLDSAAVPAATKNIIVTIVTHKLLFKFILILLTIVGRCPVF
jgi:hypothetical protein